MTLLSMQAPLGVPRSSRFDQVTDPLIPPNNIDTMLAHFPDQIYDKRESSHLVRILSALLGESGTNQLRKKYTYAHLSQWLGTLRFYELDRFMSGVFGLKRFVREAIDFEKYDSATDEEWEAISAADSSYRSRIAGFMASLQWAGTPKGIAMAASAIIGDECRVHECYEWLEIGILPPTPTRAPGPGMRREFVVQPMREITAEERHQLIRVLGRLMPMNSLLTIEATSNVFNFVPVFRAHCDSAYWSVQRKVLVSSETAGNYERYTPGVFDQQPGPYGSQYQGEAWDYSPDVVAVTASVESPDGVVVQGSGNHDRYDPMDGSSPIDYLPEHAVIPPALSAQARAGRSGALTVSLTR